MGELKDLLGNNKGEVNHIRRIVLACERATWMEVLGQNDTSVVVQPKPFRNWGGFATNFQSNFTQLSHGSFFIFFLGVSTQLGP